MINTGETDAHAQGRHASRATCTLIKKMAAAGLRYRMGVLRSRKRHVRGGGATCTWMSITSTERRVLFDLVVATVCGQIRNGCHFALATQGARLPFCPPAGHTGACECCVGTAQVGAPVLPSPKTNRTRHNPTRPSPYSQNHSLKEKHFHYLPKLSVACSCSSVRGLQCRASPAIEAKGSGFWLHRSMIFDCLVGGDRNEKTWT
jgi:hypothetical protein